MGHYSDGFYVSVRSRGGFGMQTGPPAASMRKSCFLVCKHWRVLCLTEKRETLDQLKKGSVIFKLLVFIK